MFSKHHERVIGNDNVVTFGKVKLQIERQTFRFSMAKCRVLVCEHLDGTIAVYYGPNLLGRYDAAGRLLVTHSKIKPRRMNEGTGLWKLTSCGKPR